MSRVHVAAVTTLLLAGCAEVHLAPDPGAARLERKVSGALVAQFRKARLRQDGELFVSLRLRCPSGYQLLEDPFTVTQGGVTGSGFSGGGCDDHWDRRTVRIFLDDPEGPGFQPGTVTVSGQFTAEQLTSGDLLVVAAEEELTVR